MDLDTTIKEVIVFSNRARLTRTGRQSLQAGSHSLTVKGLPVSMDPDSVWAKANGSAPAKILGVEVRKDFYRELPDGRARELTDRIEQVKDQIQVCDDETESLQKQIQHLDGVADATASFARNIARGQFSTEKHEQFIAFFSRNRQSAQHALLPIQQKQRALERELQKLEKELNTLESARPKERFAIDIDCETAEDGEWTFEIIYNIANATWKPRYDFRLTDNQLELSYMGQIIQKSGEDWQSIRLKLSTAPPSKGTSAPELDPWYIAPRPVSPQKRYIGNALSARAGAAPMAAGMVSDTDLKIPEAEMLSDMEMASEPVPVEADYLQAKIQMDGASVTYDVGDRFDIPGDGTLKKATISSMVFKPECDYIATPILEAAAFRRVKILNDSELTLLPGPVQLFENENYIGDSKIKLTAPREKIVLFFGIDNRIRIRRKLTERQTDKKFIGDKKRIHFGYEIKVQNFSETKQTITVRDHIPVSKHEQIKVKLEDTLPEPEKIDKLNRLKWIIDAEPGQEYQLQYDFTIEFPTHMQIDNLPQGK